MSAWTRRPTEAVGDVPHRHPHAVLPNDTGHERCVIAERRAEPRRARADLALERDLRALELGIPRVEPTPPVVVIRVDSRRGGRASRGPDDLRLLDEPLADDEERRLHVRGVEDAHELRRHAGVGVVVERDRDPAAVARSVRQAAAEPLRRHRARAEVARHQEGDEGQRGPEGDRPERVGDAASLAVIRQPRSRPRRRHRARR